MLETSCQYKSVSERCKECITIRSKMNEVGFETLPESKEIYQKMNDFLKDDHNKSFQGKFYVPILKKYVAYHFDPRKDFESKVTLAKV